MYSERSGGGKRGLKDPKLNIKIVYVHIIYKLNVYVYHFN